MKQLTVDLQIKRIFSTTLIKVSLAIAKYFVVFLGIAKVRRLASKPNATHAIFSNDQLIMRPNTISP